MARICVFHWNAEEARSLLTVLEAAGHSVEHHGRMASYREVRANPPEAIVIDLSRLPSHGRELAIFFRGSKSTRHIPIVFVGGEAEKVDRIRKLLPDAAYATLARVRGVLKSALANPPANPVKAAQMMDRWGHRTTAQKLGIAKDSRVAVIDPPSGYAQAVGDLPQGACFDEETTEGCPVSLWFVHGVPEFHAALPRMRKLAAHSRLWILWRKNKRARTGPARPSGSQRAHEDSVEPGSVVRAKDNGDGLDGNLIRAGCVAVGLVDYKICSVDDDWSGMVFAVKKAFAVKNAFAVKKTARPPASRPKRTARPTRSPADD
jgi:CheY-like chemotaxis protein